MKTKIQTTEASFLLGSFVPNAGDNVKSSNPLHILVLISITLDRKRMAITYNCTASLDRNMTFFHLSHKATTPSTEPNTVPPLNSRQGIWMHSTSGVYKFVGEPIFLTKRPANHHSHTSTIPLISSSLITLLMLIYPWTTAKKLSQPIWPTTPHLAPDH